MSPSRRRARRAAWRLLLAALVPAAGLLQACAGKPPEIQRVLWQETLVDDIARTLLAHPLVVAVRVASEKPDIYEDVEAVGIEVFHFKEAA